MVQIWPRTVLVFSSRSCTELVLVPVEQPTSTTWNKTRLNYSQQHISLSPSNSYRQRLNVPQTWSCLLIFFVTPEIATANFPETQRTLHYLHQSSHLQKLSRFQLAKKIDHWRDTKTSSSSFPNPGSSLHSSAEHISASNGSRQNSRV
jgi:hypothetical protein